MARRLMTVVHVVRDLVVALVSLVIIGSQYQSLGEEPVFYITVSISAVLLALTAGDISLLVLRTKRRGYFLGNAFFQMILGVLFLGLIPPLGALMLALNIAALVTLRRKKTAEEVIAHPPVPITRNYRVAVGLGTLVMAASLFLPWFIASGSSVSMFGVLWALVTKSDLPGVSIAQSAVLFVLVGLVGSPIALVCGGLGLLRRRFALAGGVLALLAGAGMAAALGSATGVGAYAFLGGGVVVLAGFFGFRKKAGGAGKA